MAYYFLFMSWKVSCRFYEIEILLVAAKMTERVVPMLGIMGISAAGPLALAALPITSIIILPDMTANLGVGGMLGLMIAYAIFKPDKADIQVVEALVQSALMGMHLAAFVRNQLAKPKLGIWCKTKEEIDASIKRIDDRASRQASEGSDREQLVANGLNAIQNDRRVPHGESNTSMLDLAVLTLWSAAITAPALINLLLWGHTAVEARGLLEWHVGCWIELGASGFALALMLGCCGTAYIRNSKNIFGEVACAAFASISAFVILRLTSSQVLWSAWVLDVYLAFVAAIAGLMIGIAANESGPTGKSGSQGARPADDRGKRSADAVV